MIRKPKKQKPVDKTIEILKKRLIEVGKIRDRLTSDLDDLEAVRSDCADAYYCIEDAIEALSRLA